MFMFYLKNNFILNHTFTLTFSHLADTFIQSGLQMMKIKAIKSSKRAIMCKCYDKYQLAVHVARFIYTGAFQ